MSLACLTPAFRGPRITVPRFLAQMLGEHIGRYPSPDGWVSTAAKGGPVHHHNFRHRHYARAVEAASLPGVRFHDLRHTCAALLIAAGRHLEEVKTYLGHSSIRVTSDRYGHLFPEARAAIADALDATYREAPAGSPRPEPEIAMVANANQRPRKAADLRFSARAGVREREGFAHVVIPSRAPVGDAE